MTTSSLRRSLLTFALTSPLFVLSGCMSLDTVNQFESEWDRKHAPGTGITGSRVIEAVTVLAKYEATLQQRELAEQRAREAQARLIRERQAYQAKLNREAEAHRSAQAKAASFPKRSSSTASAKPKPKPKSTPAPAVKVAAAPPIPKQIAGEVPDERKQGASTVMLWNTASERLVGNEVYDLSKKPKKGNDVALWSGASAQYVGTGR